MRFTHIFLAVIMAMLWGFAFVPSKYGAVNMPPLFFLFLRFSLVALLLIWFVKLPKEHIRAIVPFAICMGVGHFGLFYIALDMGVEASTAAIIWQAQVPMTLLLAAIWLKDRPSKIAIAGTCIAFGGLFVLVGEPRHFENFGAIFLMVVSCIMWAVANIQAKKLSTIKPITLNAWMAIFSGFIMMLLSLMFETRQLEHFLVADWRLHGSLVYQVVGATIVAYWAWYFLMNRYPISQIAGFILLVPFFGVISGIAVLGEPMTWRTAAGGIITLIGVSIIILGRSQNTQTNTTR